MIAIGTRVKVKEGPHRGDDGRTGIVDEIYENYPEPVRYHVNPDPTWGNGSTFWYFEDAIIVARPGAHAFAAPGREGDK